MGLWDFILEGGGWKVHLNINLVRDAQAKRQSGLMGLWDSILEGGGRKVYL